MIKEALLSEPRKNLKSISITDTGKGIAKENAEHLFSPFFSTKKDGRNRAYTCKRDLTQSWV
jgi:nitrogen-specific signal transduction histidine kinase